MKNNGFKKFIFKLVFIFGVIFLSSLITDFITVSHLRVAVGDVVDFDRYKNQLKEYVRYKKIQEDDKIIYEKVPPELWGIGIRSIYRNGRILHFTLPHRSILADDATSEFFYVIKNNEDPAFDIREFLKASKPRTLHIQRMLLDEGWYYWEWY